MTEAGQNDPVTQNDTSDEINEEQFLIPATPPPFFVIDYSQDDHTKEVDAYMRRIQEKHEAMIKKHESIIETYCGAKMAELNEVLLAMSPNKRIEALDALISLIELVRTDE